MLVEKGFGSVASKRFRNKCCVYCGGVSAGRDHVFAREFFFENERHGLPLAPACSVCNNRKSELETYATVMMPLACHPSSKRAEAHIEEALRRLGRNRQLQRQLHLETTKAWVQHNGIIRRSAMPPLDFDKIKELVRYIGIGIAFHHWGILIDEEAVVDVVPALDSTLNFIRKNGASTDGGCVSRNLGNGAAFYFAGFDPDLRKVAMVVNFYGGVAFTRRNDLEKTVFSGWIVTIDLPRARPDLLVAA